MIFPALKSFSEDKNILKQKIMLAHSFIGFFSIPIYTYIFFFAEEFILSLYGDKWFNSVIPMMILVPLFLRSSFKGPTNSLFLIYNKTKSRLHKPN